MDRFFGVNEEGKDFTEDEMDVMLEKKLDGFLKKKNLKKQLVYPSTIEQPIDLGVSISSRHKVSSGSDTSPNKGEPLREDVFALMMTNKATSSPWLFGLLSFSMEAIIILLHLIYLYQISEGTTPFDAPFKVSTNVRVGQFISVFICTVTQQDLLISVKNVIAFAEMRNDEADTAWFEKVFPEDGANVETAPSERGRRWSKFALWFFNILIPSVLMFVQGIVVVVASFVIIVQSDNIIDLLKDFTALYFISRLSEIFFFVAGSGFLGKKLKLSTRKAKNITLEDEIKKTSCCGMPLRTIVLILISCTMLGAWGAVAYGQDSGQYFGMKYPDCSIAVDRIESVNDGRCDGGVQNSIECGFDGGDCLAFNLAYPDCSDYPEAYKVGDGKCDPLYNIPECAYDGGDCPYPEDHPNFSNNVCDGGYFNTLACNYDNGECDDFNSRTPICPVEVLASRVPEGRSPPIIGDGICQSGLYLFEDCLFEGNDCASCKDIPDINLVGNGVCNGGLYASDACGKDGGDCEGCIVPDMNLVGNGVCDGGAYLDEKCSYDGGDCASFVEMYPGCIVDDVTLIGNGVCDGDIYDSEQCHNDGGDCLASSPPSSEGCRWLRECDAGVQFRPISDTLGAVEYNPTPSSNVFIQFPFDFATPLLPGVSDNEVSFGCDTIMFFTGGLKNLDVNPMDTLFGTGADPLVFCNENGYEGTLAVLEDGSTSVLISFENMRSPSGKFGNAQVELFESGGINFCYGDGEMLGTPFGAHILEPEDIHLIPQDPFGGRHTAATWPKNKCFCFDCF